jgi:hypothetical protein
MKIGQKVRIIRKDAYYSEDETKNNNAVYGYIRSIRGTLIKVEPITKDWRKELIQKEVKNEVRQMQK